jgi:hypothetical protein
VLTTDQRHLLVRKRLRPFTDEYDVLARPSDDVVAFARKSRFARELTVYRNEGRGDVLLTATMSPSRMVLDVTTDEPIGSIRIEPAWGRRVWHVEPAAGEPIRGRERSAVGAFFGGMFSRVPGHFEFTTDARAVFTVRRRFGLRRRFAVEIGDELLDRRLVVALALTLDAF